MKTTHRHITALTLLLALAPALAWAEPPGDLWVERPDGARDRVMKSSSFARLAEEVSPAVVNIIVTVQLDDPLARGSSDIPGPRGGATAYGSGFIIHPDGHVLTNNHVVEKASEIKVRLNDGREYRAEIVGTDPRTDVALVRIDANERFKAVALGDSDGLKVGERVLAIGNPLGLNHTVTSGIISALGRKDLAPGGKALESDFIQTDASINPGNSGGPLIGLSGEVIGINTAINREGQGIGFAIPINMVKALLPQLHETGYVVRTWLGVRVQAMTPVLAKSFGMKRAAGALVSEVVADSPAARGGLEAGDVILSFGGREIRDSDQLPWLVSTGGDGNEVAVELLRGGDRKRLVVTLEAIPNQKPPQRASQRDGGDEIAADLRNLGLSARALDAALARQLGARAGVVITDILKGSPALASGLRKRDVVTEVGEQAVRSVQEFYEALEAVKPGQIVRMRIMRGGRAAYVAFER